MLVTIQCGGISALPQNALTLKGFCMGRAASMQKGMDSMKRRIFKKLAAIALTAAVMITNIGVTNAAAEELLPVSGTVQAEDVGAVTAFEAGDGFRYDNTRSSSYSIDLFFNYATGKIGHSAEFPTKKQIVLEYTGDGTKTLSDAEKALFYFSESPDGSTKFPGLSVSQATNSSSNSKYINLTIAFDYDEYASSRDVSYVMNSGEPYVKSNLYLCYPHSTGNGTEIKVIKNEYDNYKTDEVARLFAYYCPMKYDLQNSKVAEYASSNSRPTYSSGIRISPTGLPTFAGDTYTVENINGVVSNDFDISATNYSKTKREVTVKLKKSSTLKDYKITAASDRLYKIKSDGTYIAVFYVVNPIDADEIAPNSEPTVITQPDNPPAEATVYDKCFPAGFAPTVSFYGNPTYFIKGDYGHFSLSSRDKSFVVKNKSTTYLKATANDDTTSTALGNLKNPENLKLFYLSSATDTSEALTKKLNSFSITEYNTNNNTITATIDISMMNLQTNKSISGKYYLWYPVDSGNGNIVQQKCSTELQINIICPPVEWNVNKKSKVTLSNYLSSSDVLDEDPNLKVYTINDEPVNDFEVTLLSDKKSADVTLKNDSKIASQKIEAGDEAFYVVKYTGTRFDNHAEYPVGTFYIISNGSGTSASADPSNPTPTILADNSISMTAGQTIDLTWDNSAKKIMLGSTELTEALTNLYEVNDDGSHKSVQSFSDASQYRWVIEEIPTNGLEVAGKSAKIKSGTSFNKSDVTDTDTITIGGAKSNKKFNNAVVVKLVGKDYKAKKSSKVKDGNSSTATFASIILYITPAVPTIWKDVNGTNLSKLGLTPVTDVDGYDQVYDLSLAEGKSVKLPFGPKDGEDKTMIYSITENSKGFSAANGTVKALTSGGSGNVICYPKYAPAKKILVRVKTTAAVKSLRANVTKVLIYPNESRMIYLGTNPPSLGTEFTIEGKQSGTFPGGSWAISGNVLTVTGNNDTTRSLSTTLNVSAAGKTIKINVASSTAPSNAASFKLSTKKLNADGFIEVNIPTGSAYNLGVALAPAAANSNFTWKFAADEPDPNAVLSGEYADVISETNEIKNLQVSGDVIKGNTSCIYYMQATSEAVDSGGDVLITPIYKINVYEPGASIVMNALPAEAPEDAEEFTVTGGVLMSKAKADTTCDKYLTGGRAYTFPLPTTAGAVKEEILWTCAKPAAIGIDTVTNPDYMTITPMQTGTFTITGKTKYTKQTFSFKVNVKSDDTAISSASETDFTIQYLSSDGTWKGINESTALNVKEKMNVRVLSSKAGAVGTVKFETSTDAVCSINSSGIITAKSAGTGKVKATVTLVKSTAKKNPISIVKDTTFTVNGPQIGFKKAEVPGGVVKGQQAKFEATVKNIKPADIKSVKWQYASSDEADEKDWADISSATSLSGKFTINLNTGTYYVRCNADGAKSSPKMMKVYETGQNIKSVSTAYTFTEYDDALAEAADVDIAEGDTAEKLAKAKKNALSKINAAYKNALNILKSTRANEGAGYGIYYIPVFAVPEKSGTTLNKAGSNDIIWTSSNSCLAAASTVSDIGNDGMQSKIFRKALAPYAIVKITTAAAQANNYTGKVTLTGTLRNSGKKVTITLNVSGTEGTVDNSGTAATSPTPISVSFSSEAENVSVKYDKELKTLGVNEAYGLAELDDNGSCIWHAGGVTVSNSVMTIPDTNGLENGKTYYPVIYDNSLSDPAKINATCELAENVSSVEAATPLAVTITNLI